MRAVLRVTTGQRATEKVVVPKEGLLSVGRSSESDLQLLDMGVSRFHCVVEGQAESLVVTDLSSSNGTFVNGQRVKRQVLKQGDEIGIGPVTLVVEEIVHPSRDPLDGLLTDHAEAGEQVVRPADLQATMQFLLPVLERPTAEPRQPDPEPDAQRRLARARRDLAALYTIGDQIHAQESIERILTVAIDTLLDVVQAERGFIVLADGLAESTGPVVSRFASDDGDIACIPVSRPVVRECIQRGVGILCQDLRAEERYQDDDSAVDHTRSVLCAPLNVGGRALGAIYLDTSSGRGTFDEHDLQLLTAISHQSALALHRAQLFEDLERLFLGAIETLVATVEAKDIYTYGHSARVSRLAQLTAERMGRPKHELEQIRIAGLLHDIGKIGIPEAILAKEGRLTFEEWSYIRSHPQIGESIIKQMGSDRLHDVQRTVRHHHERLDGSGYPDGLRGPAIPFGARILAVVDTFDAITSNRPYRTPHTAQEAIAELRRHAGDRFEPEIVEAFVSARAERLAGANDADTDDPELPEPTAAPSTEGRRA